jgi:hypothetical protein
MDSTPISIMDQILLLIFFLQMGVDDGRQHEMKYEKA